MLLIDAYNVLHVVGVLPPALAGLEAEGLGRLIGISRYSGKPAVLVCDGGPSRGASFGVGRTGAGGSGRLLSDRAGQGGSRGSVSGGVRVVYAGAGKDADSLIEEMLEGDSAARRWTVVSGDRRVQRAARAAQAKVLEPEVFLRQLVHDEKRPAPTPHPREVHKIPLGSTDVALWVREFGVDVHLGDEPHTSLPVHPAGTSQISSEAARGVAKKPPARAAGPREERVPRDGPPPAQPGPRAEPPKLDIDRGLSPADIDPVLKELIDGLEGGIRLEDLDMRRWLGEDGGAGV